MLLARGGVGSSDREHVHLDGTGNYRCLWEARKFFVFNLLGLSKICSQRQILEQMIDAVWRRREKKKHEEGDAP